MKNKILHSDFGLLFWLHLSLILLAYSSWFLFSWQWIILGSIILWIQYWFFDGCVLSQIHFGKERAQFTFVAYYFEKINLNFDKNKLTFFIRHIIPFLLMFLAIIWQIIFNKKPLIFWKIVIAELFGKQSRALGMIFCGIIKA